MAEEIRIPENEEGYVKVAAGDARLHGNLRIPEGARAVVLFVHGSGRGRSDARNQRGAKLDASAQFCVHRVRRDGAGFPKECDGGRQ
jgi:hypothetical protein